LEAIVQTDAGHRFEGVSAVLKVELISRARVLRVEELFPSIVVVVVVSNHVLESELARRAPTMACLSKSQPTLVGLSAVSAVLAAFRKSFSRIEEFACCEASIAR